MKKRLLLGLVVFYVFVVELLIFGNLWSEPRLYLVAGINFLVMVFFSVLYNLSLGKKRAKHPKHPPVTEKNHNHHAHQKQHQQHQHQQHTQTHQKKKSGVVSVIRYICQHYLFVIVLWLLPIVFASKVFFSYPAFSIWWIILVMGIISIVVIKPLVQKKIYFINKLFMPRCILFALTLFFGLLMYSWFVNMHMGVWIAAFLVSLLALFVFLILLKIFRARGLMRAVSLRGVRFYILAMAVSLIAAVLAAYFGLARQQRFEDQKPWLYRVWENVQQTTSEVMDDIFSAKAATGEIIVDTGMQEEDVDNAFLSTGGGHVLSSSFVDEPEVTGEFELDLEDIDDTNIETGEMEELDMETDSEEVSTTTVVPEPMGISLRNEETYSDTDAITYIDAIVYLIELTNAELADDNYYLKFTYMPKSSPDYVYFKTAFYRKLIGKDLKPSAKVKCKNYLVMKGILQGWDVSEYTGDIFNQYYQAAEDRGVLNSCELENYLTKNTL